MAHQLGPTSIPNTYHFTKIHPQALSKSPSTNKEAQAYHVHLKTPSDLPKKKAVSKPLVGVLHTRKRARFTASKGMLYGLSRNC